MSKKVDERYIVDTTGSIVDIEERVFYDYPEDVCKILNNYHNKESKEEEENIKTCCKGCSYHYYDGFCMWKAIYTDESCDMYTNEKLELNLDRLARLCKQYLEFYDNNKRREELWEKYPEYRNDLELMKSGDDFFLNCAINDLHRELMMYHTRK